MVVSRLVVGRSVVSKSVVSRSVVGKSVNSKAVVSRSVAGTLVSSKAVQVGSKVKISASVCSSTVVKYSVFSNHVVGR